MSETVVVLGASPKPERYSNRALHELVAHGHRVIPVNPGHLAIDGIATVPRLSAIREPVDTVTVYVNPEVLAKQIPELIALRPKRVIFNPGAESPAAEAALDDVGVPYEEACTLVLLRTGQY